MHVHVVFETFSYFLINIVNTSKPLIVPSILISINLSSLTVSTTFDQIGLLYYWNHFLKNSFKIVNKRSQILTNQIYTYLL